MREFAVQSMAKPDRHRYRHIYTKEICFQTLHAV